MLKNIPRKICYNNILIWKLRLVRIEPKKYPVYEYRKNRVFVIGEQAFKVRIIIIKIIN